MNCLYPVCRVYRQFKDTGVFFNELKDMMDKDKAKAKDRTDRQSEAK